MNACPTDQELESLLEDRVAPADAPTRASSLLTHHLESCDRCQQRVNAMSRDREFMHEIASALSDVNDRARTRPAEKPTASGLSISGYDIESEIHRGAQGVVFKALQHSTNRKVALKVLFHEVGTSLRMRQRFMREIELAAQLRHANVVTIFDSGETEDGRMYFAMEFVDGPRIDAHTATLVGECGASIAELEQRTLAMFDAICAGVAHAHQNGVIHRDLKPGNIMIDADGAPKVLDFGLAKATDAGVNERFAFSTIEGSFMGTIAYASPEQTRGNPDAIDKRSDVYALGVLLHEIITGKLPYDVTGPLAEGIDNVMNAEPQTPLRWRSADKLKPAQETRRVNRDLETIVLTALRKDADRRYQTVDALRDDIAHYIDGKPIGARRDSKAYVATKHLKRNKNVLVVGAALLALSAAIAMLSSTLSTTQEAAQSAAETVELYAMRLSQQEMWDATSGAARDMTPAPVNPAVVDHDSYVIVNAPQAPKSLNPTLVKRHGDLFVCELLFERLFWRTVDLDIIPNAHLVESITEDKDPTIKTIRLRSGLTWHDGAPLTADDIIYSWRKTVSPSVRSTKRRQASRIADLIAIDPRTIEIHLESAHATWRLSANFELIPKHIFEPGEIEDPTLRSSEYFERFNLHPIGSGPFKFESWSENELLLSRFDNFKIDGQPPMTAGLRVRWIQSPDERMAAFLDGELDLFELTDEQYRSQIYNDDFEQAGAEARRPSSRYHYIIWNCDDDAGRFHEPKIRRALAMAINTDRIKAEVTNNLAAACFGPWPADSAFSDPALRRFAHRPNVARNALRDAMRSQFQDGGDTTERDPSPESNQFYDFELLVQSTGNRDLRTAEIIRDCLENVGVGVTITRVESRSSLIQRLRDGQFDACLMATTSAVDPELHLAEFVTDGTLNFGGYSNSNVDQLLAEALQTLDETDRSRIYRRIHRILYEDQARSYLFHEPALWAVSHRLSGVRFSSRGPYYFQPGVMDWWIRTDIKD